VLIVLKPLIFIVSGGKSYQAGHPPGLKLVRRPQNCLLAADNITIEENAAIPETDSISLST
jgi:hypothetical protein